MIPDPPQGQPPIEPGPAFSPPPVPQAPAAAGQFGQHYGGAVFQGAVSPGGAYPIVVPVPQPRRTGLFRRLVMVFAVLTILGSFLLNLVLIGSIGGSGGKFVVTETVSEGDADNRIAVVTVSGAIGDHVASAFDRALAEVEQDPKVRALVVEIDSPGGEVTASDEIHDRINRYKARRQYAGHNPLVVVSMKGMATSGGYYVACAGDHLIAQPTTWTGNIGVLLPNYNFSGLMEKHGVKETTIIADGATFKNAGSPFQPESPEAVQYWKSRVDQAFDRFKHVVKTGRGTKLVANGADAFNGKVFTADEAVKLGLIDQIGYPMDAYAYAAGKVGISNPEVVRYREPMPGLIGMLFGGSAQGRAGPVSSGNSPSLSAGGWGEVLRPETLDQWRTARVLYR